MNSKEAVETLRAFVDQGSAIGIDGILDAVRVVLADREAVCAAEREVYASMVVDYEGLSVHEIAKRIRALK